MFRFHPKGHLKGSAMLALVLTPVLLIATPAGATRAAADPSATPSAASEPSYAPDPDDYRVERVNEPSCALDRVSVTIAYRGATTEIAVALIADGTNVAGQERVDPGSTLTLTGAPLELGHSANYRLVTSFLDDHTGVTVLRQFTVNRPSAESCSNGQPGSQLAQPTPTLGQPAPTLPVTGPRLGPAIGLLGLIFVVLGLSFVYVLRRLRS